MSDIDKICETFNQVGIEYTRRKLGEVEYIFVGECRNMYDLSMTFENGDLDRLLAISKFFEFENGTLASYPNF